MRHAIAFPTELTRLARLFASAGEPLYAVGGQVRNPLLGLPVGDRDICSALLPDQVTALCARSDVRCLPLGTVYGTVTLQLGGLSFEHTAFRQDEYGPGGAHRPQSVAFGGSLEQDAFRRDFTVNALYVQIPPDGGEAGPVIDPTGGLKDLDARVLRATSADPAAILQDDALRILRLARFACELGFTVDPATLAAAQAHADGLRHISPERMQTELNKILLADLRYPRTQSVPPGGQSAEPISRRFERVPPGGPDGPVYYGLCLLDELGALEYVLPELAACRGVPQRKKYHAYDVLGHMLHACASACESACEGTNTEKLRLRLAALLHDIGKPEAARRNACGHMYYHEILGAGLARTALARLRYPKADTEAVCALIAHHMFDLTGEAGEDTVRMRFAQWGYAHSMQLASLREADVRGSGLTPPDEPVATAERFRRILSAMREDGAPFSEAELACSGADIMAWTGLPAGPRIGEIKTALLRHCARKPRDNHPAALERLCRDMR